MFRLAELSSGNRTASLRIEGDLTRATIPVLEEQLANYARLGVSQVDLEADGLLSIDDRALAEVGSRLPSELQITFHTSRTAVREQLRGCGFAVVPNS